LAITARPITLTATDRTKVYGDTLTLGTSAFTKTAGTYANSEVATAATLTSANGYSGSTTHSVSTNTNEVVPTAATGTDGFLASNYGITYVSGNLAITARPITLTATNRTKVYGDTLTLGTSAFTKTAGTFANSELVTAVTLTSPNGYDLSTTRAVGTNSGEVVPTLATGTGGFSASNYDITYVSGSLAITARPITLVATNRTKVYGDVLSLGNAAFTHTTGTFANSELATAVTLTSANGYAASTTRAVGTNNSEVVPSAAIGTGSFLASNYDITYTAGGLEITARPITLTATNRTKVYGDTLSLGTSAFTKTAGTFANSELATAVTLTSANSYASSTTRAVSTNSNEVVPTSATGTDGFLASNYNITYTAGSLEITARPITLVATNRTKVYGDILTLGNSAFTHTAGTFANSELATAVTLTSLNGYDASTTHSVSNNTNEVVPSLATGTDGFLASNYDITYTSANLAITARPITLTADNRTKIYGNSLTLGATGFTKTAGTYANSELATAVTLTSANSYDASTTQAVNAGYANEVVPTAATGTGNFLASNYDITYVSGSLAITARPITLTADNRTKIYGNSLTLGTTGFTKTAGTYANSEVATAVTLTSANSYDASTTQAVNAGYANEVVPTSATGTGSFLASNYNITYTSGSLAITARPITLMATNRTKVYGDTLSLGTSAFTKTAGTYANSEVATAVTLTSANGYAASTTRAVGTNSNEVVPTTATGTDGFLASNYDITYTSSSLAITARPITLTATDRTKVYGDTLTLGTSSFTKTVGNFANSELATAVTLTSANGHAGDVAKVVGTYGSEVVPSAATGTGGFLASNYDITYVSGSLAVTQKSLTITSNARSTTYGTTLALGTSNFSQVGLVNGDRITDVTLKQNDNTTTPALQEIGTYAGATNGILASAATGTGLTNYTITYLPGTLTINALNTVTWTGAGTDNNWSTAANWTNNVIPLRSNVLNVVLPTGSYSVNFDATTADSANKPTSNISNNSNLVFNLNTAFNLSNTISGSGSINQQGSGALTISGNNATYTGNTQINTSRLHLSSSRALGSGSLVSNGGGLSMDGSIELPSLNVNGNLILHSGIYTTGSQTYNANLELAANGNTRLDTINSNITFNGTITAGINSKANQRSLLINAGSGTVVFNERVGSDRGLYANFNNNNTNLYTLRVTAGRIEIKADILTFENQIYNGPVFIGSNGTNGTTRTLISVDPSIVFNSTIDDINPTTPTHTLEAKAIAVDYSMTPILQFNGDIGGDQPLASLVSITGTQLTTSGTQVGDVSSNPVRYNGSITIGGSVTTSGDQSYTSNQITLGSTSNQQQVFKTTDNGNLDFNIGIQPNSIQINNSISNHELVIDLGRGNIGASTETAFATAGITFKEILPFVSGFDIHSDITRQKMALATGISNSDDFVADVNIGDLDQNSDTSECDVKTDDKCSPSSNR
jgi:autotransporter-associated beta strand protein